jgi:hypothetical protein
MGMFDANGDGYVSVDEFIQFLCSGTASGGRAVRPTPTTVTPLVAESTAATFAVGDTWGGATGRCDRNGAGALRRRDARAGTAAFEISFSIFPRREEKF